METIIAALIAGIASFVGSKISQASQKKAMDQAKETSDNNFQLQKEQLEYNKGLQQEIFKREDNAIQREAADLKAAGLSKTLAAGGGAGAGVVVPTQAPQQDNSAIITAQLEMARTQNEMMLNLVNTAINASTAQNNIDVNNREQDRKDLIAGVEIENTYFQQKMSENQYKEMVSYNEKHFQHLTKQLEQTKTIADAEILLKTAQHQWEKDKYNSEIETNMRINDYQMQNYLLEEYKKWLTYQDRQFGITADMPVQIKEWIMQQKTMENQFIYDVGKEGVEGIFDIFKMFKLGGSKKR